MTKLRNILIASLLILLVERSGVEPLTSTMPLHGLSSQTPVIATFHGRSKSFKSGLSTWVWSNLTSSAYAAEPSPINPDFTHFPKWARVLPSLGPYSRRHENGQSPTLELLQQAYASTSGYQYRRDAFGDQWATPKEFRQRKGGDCEDFAIMWMAWLLEHGVSDDQLWLHIVWHNSTKQLHAVLVVADKWVLDIGVGDEPGQVYGIERMDAFKPLYSINREGWRDEQ